MARDPFARRWSRETVQCVTLDDVFATHGIDRCSWLAPGCEGAEWGIVAKTGVLERVGRISMELHVPYSRRPGGAERCVQDFLALVNRVPKAPTVALASTVWILDTWPGSTRSQTGDLRARRCTIAFISLTCF